MEASVKPDWSKRAAGVTQIDDVYKPAPLQPLWGKTRPLGRSEAVALQSPQVRTWLAPPPPEN